MGLRILHAQTTHSTGLAWEILAHLRLHELNGAKSPELFFAPNNAWAFSLKDDLRLLDSSLEFFFLPALETDLLKNRGPSLHKRIERIRFFWNWSQRHRGTSLPRALFVVPVNALNQKIPSLSFWEENTLTLSIGQELSRTTLSDSLAKLGYLPIDLVEIPGEFAVRGSIVDVYSPLIESPVRIEIFGDIVQSLRTFHPASQRRIAELQSLPIPPCREFLFQETTSLRDRLRPYLDSQDWDKSTREAFLSRIDQQSFFSTIDYWSPQLSPSYASSFSAQFSEARAACIEPHLLMSELKSGRAEMESSLVAARLDGEWVPGVPEFLAESGACSTYLDSCLSKSSWFILKTKTGLVAEPSQVQPTALKSLDVFLGQMSSERSLPHGRPIVLLAEKLRAWLSEGFKIAFASSSPSQVERLNFLMSEYRYRFDNFPDLESFLKSSALIASLPGNLIEGFIDESLKIVVLQDEHIFGTRRKRVLTDKNTSRKTLSQAFGGDAAIFDLSPGDFIVQDDHGIGRYLGLKQMDFAGVPTELLEIEYRDKNKLFVPVTRLNSVHKHSSADASAVLDKMGGQTWDIKKQKTKKELASLAGELLHLYSLREMAHGPEISPKEEVVDSFAGSFPYAETPDQERAIVDVLSDLKGPKPMDRLLCGDVGYGKTEVALRATHSAVVSGFQVAILVPTTLLATQHENTFRKRLAPLGFQVAGISRFKTSKEVKDIFAQLNEGKVHVIVGTHRLLSQDVNFKKLGLLVIDEEQRFGVVHKEKLKKLRANVHVLSMTATPIPRTLNMAMSGLKEMSIITTAPEQRLSVRTHVARKKEALIKDAIESELKRGGQVFYVHNRVLSLAKELEYLQRLVPAGSIVEFVHGQMDEATLEDRMFRFYEGKIHVLLTTSIIESGLDVPNANTLIVDRADAFGLAQLYQLRGRVGRSNRRAYAYFMIPDKIPLKPDAEARLAVLESFQELGSGFNIASHDLEIRGSGDLLGRSQSGQISAIGFDAYVELLQECVAELKGEQLEAKFDPEIHLGIPTVIPEDYIAEIGLRLNFYRKLASASGEMEIDETLRELDDRFGTPPESVKNLAGTMKVKCLLRRLGVKSLTVGKGGYSVAFDSSTPVNPIRMVASVQKYPAHFQMLPDGRLIIKKLVNGQSPSDAVRGVEAALSEVASWCE